MNDASVGGSSSSGAPSSSSGDGAPGASSSGDAEAGPTDYCSLRRASGAQFCEDFEGDETSIAPAPAGPWSRSFTDHGTLTWLNEGASSMHSARTVLAIGAPADEPVGLTKMQDLGGFRSKITIELDARMQFPAWNTSTNNWVLATVNLIGQSEDGSFAATYFEIQRDVGVWRLRVNGGLAEFAAPTTGEWHHFTMVYDATSYPTVTLQLMVDGMPTTLPLADDLGQKLSSFREAAVTIGNATLATAPAVQCDYDNVSITAP